MTTRASHLRAHPALRPVLVLLALAGAVAACGETRRATELPVASRGPRVDVFLRASGSVTLDVGLQVASVRLRSEAGNEIELPLQRAGISSAQASKRLSLAGGEVPAGTYEALLLELDGATVRRAGTVKALRLLPPVRDTEPVPQDPPPGADAPTEAVDEGEVPVYELPLGLELGRRDAISLFVEWNVDASLVGEDGLRLALGLSQERAAGRLGLLYVTDAIAGTVLTVQRNTGEVVGSVPAGSEPRGLALGEAGLRVFTANAGDGSIAVLDARTGWTRYSIPVQLGARTADIAAVEGGAFVAAVNPALDTVSVFDVRSLMRAFDVRVGRRPVRLVAAGDPQRLFVACRLNDSLDVVDIGSRSLVASLPVGIEPTAVAVGRRGRVVMVGHRSAVDLYRFDVNTLAALDTIQVGDEVTAILADLRRDRVYVARTRPNEIAVVDLGVQAVTRRIRISGRVEALAQPREGSVIYGACPDLGALVVVNVLRGREEAPLPCGNAPSYVVATD